MVKVTVTGIGAKENIQRNGRVIDRRVGLIDLIGLVIF